MIDNIPQNPLHTIKGLFVTYIAAGDHRPFYIAPLVLRYFKFDNTMGGYPIQVGARAYRSFYLFYIHCL